MSEETGRHAENSLSARQPSRWWWLGQLLLTCIACFFAFFGISLLVASYRLGDPFSFIMTFFAASLIILISIVMVIGFVFRMRRVMLIGRSMNDHEVDDDASQ
jgi:nitrogen fixation/metabolism regulation signal transduction histidine kinase